MTKLCDHLNRIINFFGLQDYLGLKITGDWLRQELIKSFDLEMQGFSIMNFSLNNKEINEYIEN